MIRSYLCGDIDRAVYKGQSLQRMKSFVMPVLWPVGSAHPTEKCNFSDD
jgi:hypothetical protein